MAAVTHGVSTASTSNTTSYASGSFTPAAGDLLVVFVTASGTVAAGTMTDSQGLGFTKVTSALARSSADTIYCFVANALAAASAMTVTFDCTGDAATGAIIQVARVSGITLTGSSAIKQSAKTENHAGLATPAATFGASALTGNPTLGVVGNATNPATLTPPTSWTEQADAGYATPTTGAEYVSRDSGFTGTTITWGGNSGSTYGVVIVEINTNAPPTVALNTPADAASVSDTTPGLDFTGTDADADTIEYEIEVDTVNTFDSQVGSPVTIDSYAFGAFDTNDSAYGATDFGVGQSFTGSGVTATSCDFSCWRQGNPSGNMVAKIYAHSGTFGTSSVPTGSALAVSDAISIAGTPNVQFTATFVFTGANIITLVNGTKYVIVIEFTGGDINNCLMAVQDNTSPTHAGNASTVVASSWVARSGQDWYFHVYNTPATPLVDKFSVSDAGFVDVTNGADTHPFASGDQIEYTVQSALSLTTYYWRVRAIDPSGTNAYGAWSSTRSFVVISGTFGKVFQVNQAVKRAAFY